MTVIAATTFFVSPAAIQARTPPHAHSVPKGHTLNIFRGHRNGDQAWQWEWEKWLPDKWARIGACETGYGRRPGRWDWNSGIYQGAFGFYYGTWDAYKPVAWWPDNAYEATPWQQYQVALEVYRHHGYGAWGCGGA